MNTEMNEHGLYDIYEVLYVPFWQTTTFYWILGSICALLCLILGWYTLRLYRIHKKQSVAPAWDRALAVLATLQGTSHESAYQCKLYYGIITDTLKWYLHERYGFDVIGKTDNELLAYLREQQQCSITLIDDIHVIINGGNLVKFAQETATGQHIQEHIDVAIMVVQRTIPSS